MGEDKVVVIGAGIGGLVAAALLAARGLDVTVVESAAHPGGKMRNVSAGGASIEAGPTVFTMRHLFEEIFDEAGSSFASHITTTRATTLARHSWAEGDTLDLHADHAESRDAIGRFAGAAEARGFDAFSAEAARIHATLYGSFMRRPRTSPIGLTWRLGLSRLAELQATRPYETLWSALGGHFRDPRLMQLFGRYATYCGSSPFKAPATLMLIAHVEASGVWLVEGGLHRIAQALADVAHYHGARFRYNTNVAAILTQSGRAAGVALDCGEQIAADSIIANADPSALADGRFGKAAMRACRTLKPPARSLSALTWAVLADTGGAPLQRHNIVFSEDYAREFADLANGRLPGSPSVYVCAQDRNAQGFAPRGPERLQIIVNAPPRGDAPDSLTQTEIDTCETRMLSFLQRSGLCVRWKPEARVLTTPVDYESRFPSTGGALYGRASHGWAASFLRPGSKTRIPGLYLAGGATHPGAGVPMAALSGRLASHALMQDRTSMRLFHPAAIAGGMSTPSATTATMV